MATKTRERKKLERLCRYISRPAASEERLIPDITGKCQVSVKDALQKRHNSRYLRAVDLMAKLAALVPKPRANLTRYHGVLAPNSKQRMLPARLWHRDVPNAHPLVIQNILSHLNTKNDEVVELLPPQSRAPPEISLFE